MGDSPQTWERLGRILTPRTDVPWMATHTGAAFARRVAGTACFDLYVGGRDTMNRSAIGVVRIDLRDPSRALAISPQPVLSRGEHGTFDENGVSYPCIVQHESESYLFYTGWLPMVLTPFQNDLGLAIQRHGTFRRVSRAPILPRNHEDYLSIGSAYSLIEDGKWRLWYTSFTGWGESPDVPKHQYVIKYAESKDGIHWERPNHTCIDLAGEGEHSIARPSVLKLSDQYHMWYCYRGDAYGIGYAISRDGIHWERKDHHFCLDGAPGDWESESQCYPHVFPFEDHLYLLYCGNEYGRTGLGLARLPLSPGGIV